MVLKSIDWSNSTNEQRKALYVAVKRLVDSGAIDWNALYERALGTNANIGIGYENNFREGRIGRRNAALIYQFLQREFPEAAWEVHYRHSSERNPVLWRWRQFLDLNANPEAMVIIPLDGWDQFKATRERPQFFSISEQSVIALDSPIEGVGICLWAHGHYWHLQWLSEFNPTVRVIASFQILTRKGNGSPTSMSFHDPGVHSFLAMVGREEFVATILDQVHDHGGVPVRESVLDSLPDFFKSEKEPWFMARATVLLLPDDEEGDDSIPGAGGEGWPGVSEE